MPSVEERYSGPLCWRVRGRVWSSQNGPELSSMKSNHFFEAWLFAERRHPT